MERLNILSPVGYPWDFNGPRYSENQVFRSLYLPLNRVSWRLEGVTAFALNRRKFDLCHAFNRIPLDQKRFIIGFESHLPRAFTWERTRYFEWLRRRLASDRCLGIYPISQYAKNIFRLTHEDSPEWSVLQSKMEVRYPNVVVEDVMDSLDADLPPTITFVGGHFARKGGFVAIRLAEIAELHGLRIKVNIISALKMGGKIWTDPSRSEYYESWIRRMDHPFINLYPGLPNGDVVDILRGSHFCLLTTFGDTFGFSVLESFANYCPVIATRQGAIPELVNDENGLIIDLETNSIGDWVYSGYSSRDSPKFEKIFTDEVERIAHSAFEGIVRTLEDKARYRSMRVQARKTVESRFEARSASRSWDDLYRKVLKS